MPNFVTLSFRKMVLVALLFWSATGLGANSSSARGQALSCRSFLSPLRVLDLQKLGANDHAIYEFEIPGFHLLAEVSANTERFGPKLHRFMLTYDPNEIGRFSPYRSVLGNKPMTYTEKDLRYFSHAYIAGYGLSMEFYLRLPNDPDKLIDHGPLLHVALESGHVYGYAAGTDVDGEIDGILSGSFGAMGNFVSGLVTEMRFQNLNRKSEAAGQFYIKDGRGKLIE